MRSTSLLLIVGAIAGAVSAAPIVLPPGTHVPNAPSLPKARLAAEINVEEEKRQGGGYTNTWKRQVAGVAEDFSVTWKRDAEAVKPAENYGVTWKRDADAVKPAENYGVTWKRDADAVKPAENYGVTWKRVEGVEGGYTPTWKRDASGPVANYFPGGDKTWKREAEMDARDGIGGNPSHDWKREAKLDPEWLPGNQNTWKREESESA